MARRSNHKLSSEEKLKWQNWMRLNPDGRPELIRSLIDHLLALMAVIHPNLADQKKIEVLMDDIQTAMMKTRSTYAVSLATLAILLELQLDHTPPFKSGKPAQPEKETIH